MSSIQERTIVNTMYRVRIRPEGLPTLSLTFSTHEEAEEWLDEHEEAYIKDPWPYIEWLCANRASLKMHGLFHVHIPLERFMLK